ncbi:MAG: class B sortase [Bacilli bacterium]|nr:class B sortase [Bacilli bacterium]
MKRTILKILEVLFIILIIGSLINILSWYNDKRKVKKIVNNVSDYLILDNDSYAINEEIIKINEDTIGWIKIENTNINYPIVQTNNNDYYLRHDYDGNRNAAGWIFMDYRNSMDDQNIVIYGHHRKDGIMFGDIDKLMKKSYYDDNDGKILLVINGENKYYQIFSVYEASSTDYYADRNFDDFEKTLEEFKSRSKINFDTDLTGIKQILTLSTCHDNNKDRLVVQAYEILT